MSKEDSRDDGEQEQEQPQAVMPQSGPDRDQMAAEYLPEKDDWVAKTLLDLNDPHAIAALGQMGVMYPEVDELQPMIDEFSEVFLKGRTSVGGSSREEYRSIIEGMFGGGMDDDTKKMATLLGADVED